MSNLTRRLDLEEIKSMRVKNLYAVLRLRFNIIYGKKSGADSINRRKWK